MTDTPKLPSELSEDLRTVLTEITGWRHKHKGRGRIPEDIWDAAVAVSCVEGAEWVAEVLRLPFSSLSQRMDLAQRGPGPTHITKFVEVTSEVANDDKPPPVAVITVTGPKGEHFSVELPPDAWDTGGDIIGAFLWYLERP